ncbi:MAG: response regulator [Shimia sp.]
MNGASRHAISPEVSLIQPVVLVLEDEPMIQMDLAFALEDEGARVLCAGSVREALERIEADRPHVAILDVNLGRGETCKPVADHLVALAVPFLLHSGDLNRQGELVASLGTEIVPKPTPSHVVARRALDLLDQ